MDALLQELLIPRNDLDKNNPSHDDKDTTAQDVQDVPHYTGHRTRLRQRFMQGNQENFPDYELLELILCMAVPRTDMKPLAKTLLKRFEHFGCVVCAEIEDLEAVPGVGPSVIAGFRIIRESLRRILLMKLREMPLLDTPDKVANYCYVTMAFLKVEQFRVLFLDRRHRLICDEIQQEGTIDHTSLYPREVVKRALNLGASGILLVHNHPTGDPTPSQADMRVTEILKAAAALLAIRVLDHIVVGRFGYISFREKGLLS